MIRRIVITCVALLAAAATVAVAPSGAEAGGRHHHRHHHTERGHDRGTVVDLLPDQVNPTDGATYKVWWKIRDGRHASTMFWLQVKGLDTEDGRVFGVHVHTASCAEGGGPHWNATGGTEVNPDVEVWLDLTVRRGKATSVARIGYAIPAGEGRSIVIHDQATAPTGAAGTRLACIDLE